jgi:hypothetical protein
MKRFISQKQKTFGIVLFLVLVAIWQQESLKKIIPYLDIMLWIIISIVLLISFIFIYSKIRDKNLLKTVTQSNRGTKAERDLVLKLLKQGIPAQTIFHDLYVKKYNGEYAQIDLAVVSNVGIIVIEVKDYSGWIFGNGNYSQWTQVLAHGKIKNRFYNPIMQNNKHIIEIRKQAKQFENIPFYSMVVFYGDCVLKDVNFIPKGTFLVKPKRVREVMKIITKKNEPAHYTSESEILGLLARAVRNGINIETQYQHIENIKDMLGKERIFD